MTRKWQVTFKIFLYLPLYVIQTLCHEKRLIERTLKSSIIMQKIAFASDHAGYELKQLIMKHVAQLGYEPVDFGTYSTDSCDYPDFAHPAAESVEKGGCAFGIGMCGSGNGMQMTLNKHQKIRAALCWTPELARLAKQHNNANFLVMPARFITPEQAYEITDAYLDATFEGGRHERRIEKIPVKGCGC